MRRTLILATCLLPLAGAAAAQTKGLPPATEGNPAAQQTLDGAYDRLQQARQGLQRGEADPGGAKQTAAKALQELRAAMDSVPPTELNRQSILQVQQRIERAEQELGRAADAERPRSQNAVEALQEVERSVSEYRRTTALKQQ